MVTVRDHLFPLRKTLVFGANEMPHTSHADQLVNTAGDVFGRGDAFVGKITGRVDRPLQSRTAAEREQGQTRHLLDVAGSGVVDEVGPVANTLQILG